MSNFADFARYYDLFYRDKDYAAEARFVQGLLQQHAPGARRLLELGCGTARHAVHWVDAGFTVTGIDRSAQMLQEARRTAAALPPASPARLTLVEGDVTRLPPGIGMHDAVVSLFHVVNYQVDNDALAGLFDGARRALDSGGVFLFDFWYGPAVLMDPPVVRVRELQNDASETVIRIAEPDLDVNRNTVTVNYRLLVSAPAAPVREYRESHRMRYLFLPEIEMLGAKAGFRVESSGRWMDAEPLGQSTWLGWAVLRAS